MLNGYIPIYSQFGEDIYVSDVVQQAVSCIVTEMQKLNPMHIRKNGNDYIPVKGSIQRVLSQPNPLMTTADFIGKVMWQLMLNYNAFIVPVWADNGELESLVPIAPVTVEFIEDRSQTMYVKLTFRNAYQTTVPYDDIIHIRHRYSVNEFMGGNEFGQPDNKALIKTLELNDHLLKGVSNAMKASTAVNGVVKFKSMLDNGKTEKALRELEEKLRNSESGFLPLDLTADFTPIKRDTELVDDKTLKFVDEKILRHFGVPLCILTGDYTPAQYAAFYQKTLEPFIIAMSQAFTKTIFTDREKSIGNEIKLFPKELVFMSVEQTLEMIKQLSYTGSLFENEKRAAFGLPPLAELEGKRYMSLNWVDVDIAQQYQLGAAKNANDNRLKSKTRTDDSDADAHAEKNDNSM